MSTADAAKAERLNDPKYKKSWAFDFKKNWALYIMFVPVLVYEIVLHYIPMFGIIMAFEDYNVVDGYFGSPWVGFKHFIDLFTGEQFLTALRNTVCIALIKCTIGFFPSIIFAFLLSLLPSQLRGGGGRGFPGDAVSGKGRSFDAPALQVRTGESKLACQ